MTRVVGRYASAAIAVALGAPACAAFRAAPVPDSPPTEALAGPCSHAARIEVRGRGYVVLRDKCRAGWPPVGIAPEPPECVEPGEAVARTEFVPVTRGVCAPSEIEVCDASGCCCGRIVAVP